MAELYIMASGLKQNIIIKNVELMQLVVNLGSPLLLINLL